MAKALRMKLLPPLALTLLLLGLFVFVPMLSAFEYSIRTPATGGYGWTHYHWAISEEDFFHYIFRSTWLSGVTVLITLLILVPTLVWIHLSDSKIRGIIDGLSLLPLVIPVVAFAVGAQISFPEFVQNTVLELPFLYFVLALPYAYRSLDIGLNSIPLKTLSEAALAPEKGGSRPLTARAGIALAHRRGESKNPALTMADVDPRTQKNPVDLMRHAEVST